MPIYKITFKDGSVYLGGDNIYDSKWIEIPDKAIACLEYFISNNSSICLKDFEAYTHQVEATNNVFGPKGTDLSQKLHNIYIMGKLGNKVTSHRIALNGIAGTNKYHKGDITTREVEFGKEFRGRGVTNWKRGVK